MKIIELNIGLSSERKTIEISENGVTWWPDRLPSKLSPLLYASEEIALQEIERRKFENLRKNDVAPLQYRVAPLNLNWIECLNALTGRGFVVLSYRLVESVSNDGPETCLAVKAECPEGWQTHLASLAEKWGQDCIAIAGFIGPAPYDTFCAEYWKTPDIVREWPNVNDN